MTWIRDNHPATVGVAVGDKGTDKGATDSTTRLLTETAVERRRQWDRQPAETNKKLSAEQPPTLVLKGSSQCFLSGVLSGLER
jgi:hypothetical protein